MNKKRMKQYFILGSLIKVSSFSSVYCFILKQFCNAQLLWQELQKYSY